MVSKPVRTRESRAEHSKKLLNAAYDLVPEVGIRGLRTRDIAQRAGVHLATFHYCFESKDALLEALYQEIVDRMRAVIDSFTIDGHTAERRLEEITAVLVKSGASVRSSALVGGHASRYTVAAKGAPPIPAGR